MIKGKGSQSSVDAQEGTILFAALTICVSSNLDTTNENIFSV